MKKMLILLLCALVCFSSAALAETVAIENGSTAYDMSIDLPEGATMTDNTYMDEVDLTACVINYAEETAPTYYLMIAYDELFGDASLSDMDETAEKAFFDYAVVGFEDPSYETRMLDDGVEIMILNEGGASDYAYVMTVYHGYFVSIYIAHEDYAALTEEDIAGGVTLLDAVTLTKRSALHPISALLG